MKMLALVLIGFVIGLGLVFLPTLGTTSFFSLGSATQYAAGEEKNTSGTVDHGNIGTLPVETEGNSVYRSISESPAGPLGAPGAILAIGVAVAAGAYLIIRRSSP
jgi:hypothetical protein